MIMSNSLTVSTWVLGSLNERKSFDQNTLPSFSPLITHEATSYALDDKGFLRHLHGQKVKGWYTDSNGRKVKEQHPYDLNLMQLAHICRVGKATSLIELQQNLPISTPQGFSPGDTRVMIYNHVGEAHALYLRWKKLGPFVWEVTPHIDAAASIMNFEGRSVKLHPITIAFNIHGAPISYNGQDDCPRLCIEWPDRFLTSLVLNLGSTRSFEGITCRGDDISYAAYSDGHEGTYTLKDIESIHINATGLCTLHLCTGESLAIAQIATTGSH